MSEKMELWNLVCVTDPEHTKFVNQRGGFTAISAQYQLQIATEQWGKYGETWGLYDLKWGIIGTEGDPLEITLDATFRFPGGEFPISTDCAFRAGGDSRKKLTTDATTKALSKLGFNADVFLGKYDDNKYVEELKQTKSDQSKLDLAAKARQVMGANGVTDGLALEYMAEKSKGKIKTIADFGEKTWVWLTDPANVQLLAKWCDENNAIDPNSEIPF